ncbi:MAG: hypothetical protein JJT89_03755 [Nitriliruptoraceae bacterium]|nr:hypothetical protein [Nitriliruptoraceae bacterium]
MGRRRVDGAGEPGVSGRGVRRRRRTVRVVLVVGVALVGILVAAYAVALWMAPCCASPGPDLMPFGTGSAGAAVFDPSALV